MVPVTPTCLTLPSSTRIACLRARTHCVCFWFDSPTFRTPIGTKRRPQRRPRAPARFEPIRNDLGPLFRQVDAGEKRTDRAPCGRVEGQKDILSQDFLHSISACLRRKVFREVSQKKHSFPENNSSQGVRKKTVSIPGFKHQNTGAGSTSEGPRHSSCQSPSARQLTPRLVLRRGTKVRCGRDDWRGKPREVNARFASHFQRWRWCAALPYPFI